MTVSARSLENYQVEITARNHMSLADEPTDAAGLAILASCLIFIANLIFLSPIVH